MTQTRFAELKKELQRLFDLDTASLTTEQAFSGLLAAPTPTRDALWNTLTDAERAEYLQLLEDELASQGTRLDNGTITY